MDLTGIQASLAASLDVFSGWTISIFSGWTINSPFVQFK